VTRAEIAAAYDELVAGTEHVAGILVDLDQFRSVRAAVGLERSDGALIEMARRILEVVSGEAMVVRWGGDEFLLVSPAWDTERADEMAGLISDAAAATPVLSSAEAHLLSENELRCASAEVHRQRLRFFGPFTDGTYAVAMMRGEQRPPAPEGAPFAGMPVTSLYVTASPGAVVLPQPGSTFADLLMAAEEAMRSEKRRRSGSG
jgi:diguanylate cyclase (GGDEF)-like protein